MAEIKLKTCPFCGGEAHVIKCKEAMASFGTMRSYKVECAYCFCGTGRYPSEEKAVNAWNRRKDGKGEPMERERIIEALKICDSNYDGVVCKKCPIKDEDYNGSWCDKDGDCYQHLMREAAELLSEQSAIKPVATDTNVGDTISRQAAIDALWKALYEYEDKTAKKFQESEDLDIQDWIEHRIFIQNMNDIDRQTILNLPPIQPERAEGEWVLKDHLWECNKCGCRINVKNPLSYENEWSYFFCPHCGTKMPIAVQRF